MKERRKNGEGSWGTKIINGFEYQYYRDKNRHYFYGKTVKEINEKRKKFEKKNKLSADDKDIRKQEFGDYVKAWLLEKKKLSVKRNTTDGYEDCITGQLLNCKWDNLARIQVGDLQTSDLINYYSSLSQHYSRGTIKKNYAIISQCIKYGNKHGHFSQNIDLEEIVIPNEDIIKKKKKEIRFLTEEDIEKFCKEARRINQKGFCFGKLGEPTYGNNAYLLMFILFTGLRVSEAIELQWGDININEKYFTVSKHAAVVKDRESGSRISASTSTKTKAGYRSIPLSKKAMEIIRYEDSLNPKHQDSDYVFITRNGDKVKSRQNINRTLCNIMSRAGCSIEDCSPHELRHTFGSILIKHGVDIKVVSELLGHQDISVTYNVYIHILNEQKVSAINMLDDVF